MTIITDLLQCFLLAAFTASAGFFLDYCLGNPMSDEPKTKEIFSRYSLFLAKRRLIGRDMLKDIEAAFHPMLNDDNPGTRADGLEQMKKTILISGRKFFNWEKAAGMCPYCTNFWICVICCLFLFFFAPLTFIPQIFYFLIVPVFSHSILRKL